MPYIMNTIDACFFFSLISQKEKDEMKTKIWTILKHAVYKELFRQNKYIYFLKDYNKQYLSTWLID